MGYVDNLDTPPASRQGHGSRACYIQGCRHPDCCEANRLYMRAYRDGLRGTTRNRLGPFRTRRRHRETHVAA